MSIETETAEERAWAAAAAALRASEQDLDPLTLSRLRSARLRAVAAAHRPHPVNWALPMALAAGLTAWALAPRLAIEQPGATPLPLDALDLLADQGGPEFYENLEMYEWLEAREANDRA